ncbi:integrase arm-type DNA-binding domain-containing protein [Litoricolaceae bacterium]|nr:integrase arm-type DNA-binding domain-containing protein [Litorivicinaceae bacterium]
MANKALTARRVETLKTPGIYVDFDGLRLVISKTGRKRWVYRYMRDGKSTDLGLGSFPAVSLQHARMERDAQKRLLAQGIDPKVQRDEEARRAKRGDGLNFSQAVSHCIDAIQGQWSNAKHAAQWHSTLATYAEPILGELPVETIRSRDIVAVLQPIWTSKHETAMRVRQRIEKVFSWCIASGYADGPNPAIWRGSLEHLLPNMKRTQVRQHFKALPFQEAPQFYQALTELQGCAALGFRWLVLTASRTTEARLTRWDEIDVEQKIWTVPAERMKSRRPHVVPLSTEACRVLEAASAARYNEFVFPGNKRDTGLSNGAFLRLLAMHFPNHEMTPHGCRSTFRDWAEEQGKYTRHAIETSLAHTVRNHVEAAYLRTNVLQLRRQLLDDWAQFLTQHSP